MQQPASDAAGLFASAREQHRVRAFPIAERLYRQAIAADPDHLASRYFLGILAIETGRFAEAADALAHVTARRAAPDAHYHLALALQSLGRRDEAAANYRRAIALKPDYAEAHMNLGNVLAERGQAAEAVRCYERLLALVPRSALAHYNLANVLAGLGRLPEAEAHFRDALACEPRFAEAWGNLGNVLRDLERGAEAEQAYRRALALKPDHAEAHNNLGVVMAARGALAEAIEQYRGAVALRPHFAEAHNNLGLALARRGDQEGATACFRAALAARPEDLDAAHHLARALFAQGAAAEAVGLLTGVLDRNGNAETRSLFAFCLRGLGDAELERVRPYVLRALREGWANSGELEAPSIALVKRGRAMAACIALANAAYLGGTVADLAQLLS